MAIAVELSKLSKDPSTKVGCVITDKRNRIVGHGYNGMADRMQDCKELWDKKDDFVIHAEANAIRNATVKDLSGCTAYVTLQPCKQCLKMLLAYGISKIIYKTGRLAIEKDTEVLATYARDVLNVTIRIL